MAKDTRYVVGIDSSTQSVKAIAWTRDGLPAAEGRAPLDISLPRPLHAEQDADQWWVATRTALKAVTAAIDPASIDGVAISNQRETMVLVDEQNRPLAPATLWLDRRAQAMTQELSDVFGAETLHGISGKPVGVIPCLYRLAHMRRHTPELLDKAHLILDVNGFLLRHLTGTSHATWTSADPFGIFDIREKSWSRPLLDHLKIRKNQLPDVLAPGRQAGTIHASAAAETGLREGTPIFAAGGDGHCASLGVNAVRPGIVYLNLGTAVVSGVWAAQPELSRFWRTLISPTGEGYLLESCQRSGAFFLNWFIDNFAGGRSDQRVFAKLDEAAASIPVGSDGVSVCSYLVGCMDPHWDEDARATFTGMAPEHTTAHLYRACLEAITLEFARSLVAVRDKRLATERILAIGGGASNPVWLKMIADSTSIPVTLSLSNEASALGAGIYAAVGAGWYQSLQTAAEGMTRTAGEIEPDLSTASAWAALSARQARVYAANRMLV
ncbi:xylulokinase [Mesorhizobium sp. L103C119B0]|uniref:xylulokinase n=1 Tax=Mesorhizobium sp. L103C119B0 TaxID=1287085 RepID=UPI0003CFDCBD|nr:FGGY-family carbohydrate kinase [Mesorhizobium sp. L103C119B0]ESZ68112.1 xylulokinase [Mesorhizobium sp. L103C119B0]